MKENIWDLKPFGGGRPVLVSMEGVDANEAIQRDPERYTRTAPEGTVQHDIEQRRLAAVEKLAQMTREMNERLSEVSRKRRDTIAEIETKRRDEERAAAEKRAQEAQGDLPPNRDGDIQQANTAAAEEEASIRAEFDARRAEIMRSPDAPPQPEAVQVKGLGEPMPVPPQPAQPLTPTPTVDEINEAQRLESERLSREQADAPPPPAPVEQHHDEGSVKS